MSEERLKAVEDKLAKLEPDVYVDPSNPESKTFADKAQERSEFAVNIASQTSNSLANFKSNTISPTVREVSEDEWEFKEWDETPEGFNDEIDGFDDQGQVVIYQVNLNDGGKQLWLGINYRIL